MMSFNVGLKDYLAAYNQGRTLAGAGAAGPITEKMLAGGAGAKTSTGARPRTEGFLAGGAGAAKAVTSAGTEGGPAPAMPAPRVEGVLPVAAAGPLKSTGAAAGPSKSAGAAAAPLKSAGAAAGGGGGAPTVWDSSYLSSATPSFWGGAQAMSYYGPGVGTSGAPSNYLPWAQGSTPMDCSGMDSLDNSKMQSGSYSKPTSKPAAAEPIVDHVALMHQAVQAGKVEDVYDFTGPVCKHEYQPLGKGSGCTVFIRHYGTDTAEINARLGHIYNATFRKTGDSEAAEKEVQQAGDPYYTALFMKLEKLAENDGTGTPPMQLACRLEAVLCMDDSFALTWRDLVSFDNQTLWDYCKNYLHLCI